MTLEELKARADALWKEFQELEIASGVKSKRDAWFVANEEYKRELTYQTVKAEKEGQ